MKDKNGLLYLLNELHIKYKSCRHEPLFTVEDAEKYAKDIPGTHCKNLFVNNTDDDFYLVVVSDKKRVNLKKLAKELGCKRLYFSSIDLLDKYLGIKPGCVTPFALINDTNKEITVILDMDILKENEMCFHPLVNDETIIIKSGDFIKFLNYNGQKILSINF